MLPVSAPFHCALMQPAAHVMSEALAAVPIAKPLVPVVVNVRAEAVTEPDRILDLLIAQVTGSVRWRESVLWMQKAGVAEFWEIGAGKALSGMIKRTADGAVTRAIGAPEDIAALRG
jgi:[acyl-carrier-protein] S-malonyltransferase